jgi:hypothetical protein
MSQGWERDDWRLDEARSRRLPRVEDLPQTADGYDRAAVEAAFESFYRHAAEVDRTLDVLESVAAFQREAGALRADIRALRAASWGPVPTLRHTVATTAVGRADRGRAPLEAWPRIALYSAFIIFVAVGSAVADLSSGAIVALILASWLVVGVAELAVSGLGGRVGRAPRGYPEWAGAGEAEPEAVPQPVAGAEPLAEAEEADEEPRPEESPAWRPWSRPEEPAAELEPVEPEPEPEAEAELEAELEPALEAGVEPAAEADEPEFVPALEPFGQPPEAPPQPVQIVPEVEPLEEAEPEPEPAPASEAEPEPEPASEADPEPLPEAEPEPEQEPEPEAEAEPAAEAEAAADAEPAPDPEAEPAADAEPVAETPVAAPSRRLRFWRRRPAEESAALEPLPEPRHVRLVDVAVDEAAAAEAVPVAVDVDAAEAEPEPEPEVDEAAASAVEAEREPEPEPVEAEPEPVAPAAEADEEPESDSEPEPAPEPEAAENLDDTDERPAVALAPSSLRLRRGRR